MPSINRVRTVTQVVPNNIPPVSLYIRIEAKDGSGRYDRVPAKNPPTCGPKDNYCLHYYEHGKRKWQQVGQDINAALKMRFETQLRLMNGTPATGSAVPERGAESRTRHLALHPGCNDMKSERTSSGYEYTLNEFAKTCDKPVSQITVDDLQTFAIADFAGVKQTGFFVRCFQ
jgi:hypothetical protein